MLWIGGDSIEGTLRPVLLGEWTSTGHFADQYYFDFPFRKEATNTHYCR